MLDQIFTGSNHDPQLMGRLLKCLPYTESLANTHKCNPDNNQDY